MRCRSWLAALAIASASLSVSTVSFAAGEPDAPAVAKAKSLFDAGGRAYENGEFDVALQAFEQAYAIFPKETLLFSMAQAHRRLFIETQDGAHQDDAIRLFRAYLDKVKDGKRRAEANKLLGELSERRAPTTGTAPATPTKPRNSNKTRLYVSSVTPGATVSVDGGAPVPANKTVEIAPGKHTLRISAEGFSEQAMTIEAAPEEVVPVTSDLKEKPAVVEVLTTAGAAVNVDGRFVGEAPLARPLELGSGEHFVAVELAGHTTRSNVLTSTRGSKQKLELELDPTVQRQLSFAALGTAAVTALAAGVFTGVAFYEQGLANDVLDKQATVGLVDGDLDDYASARTRRDQFTIAAAVSGGAAGALTIVGLGLLLADPPERAIAPARKGDGPVQGPATAPALDELTIVPLVSPTLAGVAAGFRF